MSDNQAKTPADAAAAWYVRSHAPVMPADERAALDEWIRNDAAGKQAWAQLGKLDVMLEQIGEDPAIVALRDAARAPVAAPASRRWMIGGALAAALVAAIGLPFASGLIEQSPDQGTATSRHYAAAASPRSVALPDGSTMLLDARSAADVSLGEVRAVTLAQGRALFTVAKNKAHPFVVSTNGDSVTALGTQFSVERAKRETVVALLEGSVRVVTRAGTHKLQPGETLRASDTHVMLGHDAEAATSWRSGRLDFSAVPLADVAASLSRYGSTRIIIADRHLARQPYSGSFTTDGGADALVAALVATRAARVASKTSDTITLTR
ncbi:FecR family protein [Sphingomonas sp. CCH5-D11]|uniref:FecR family protein n=1 Tax=Sphingomonas sp. CCH5-D11 TaxID=1768786 RepID=UPI0008363E0F|nr:FecR domain-containing protein [Sphingomonas sp. CCH5-D11]